MYLLLIYFLILIIPLIVMPKHIRLGTLSPYRTVLQATLVTTAAAAIVFMAASVSGQGLFAQMQALTDDMAKDLAANPMIADAFDQASVSESDRAEMFEQIYDQTFAVMPACIMSMGAVAAYIEYMILAKILGRRGRVNKLPKLREFSFPNSAFMGIMGMYLITWILTETGAFSDDMMYANINFLFDFAFSLQGLSVVLMMCYAKRLPKALGIAAAIILWMTFIGKTMLVILGMLDLIFGFKKKLMNMEGRIR